MSYPGRVKIAEKDDEEAVMALCKQLWRENGIFSMDDAKVRATLHKAFDRDGGILGIIKDDVTGKLEAMIYMMVSTFWYSNDAHLEEVFCYVSPIYRKTNNAVELMKFAKWCTDQSGLPLIIGVISNERTEGKVRLYKRQFQEPVGSFFLYKKNGEK